MAYARERKYSLGDFFSCLMSNFGRLLLANVLFSIPLAVFTGTFVFIMLRRGISVFAVFLLIPLMSPFSAGLINVCRKISADRKCSTFKDYFGGIRNNWKFFLVNSFFLYILSVSVWASTAFFSQNNSGIMIVLMIFMILTAVLFVLIELSAVVMAVSVELKFAEIIRNSLIMVINGFTNHLKTLLSLIFMASILYTIVVLMPTPLVSLIVLTVLTVTVVPSTAFMILVYNSYQNVEKIVIKPYLKQKQEEARDRLEKEKEDSLTVEDLMPLSIGDPEEYVFLNGKTVKRKTILKMIEVRKSGEQSQE